MKAYEFPVQVLAEGMLDIPAPVAQALPRGEIVRVILLVSEPVDPYQKSEWASLTAREFFRGYANSDSIYGEVESQ